eukprot:COSAG05_NODE_468_length_9525_cov_30.402292_9_plen_77_part_00
MLHSCKTFADGLSNVNGLASSTHFVSTLQKYSDHAPSMPFAIVNACFVTCKQQEQYHRQQQQQKLSTKLKPFSKQS